MIKAGIIGATGYAGSEIVRLLLGHKEAEIAWYGSRSYIDKKYADIYQNFLSWWMPLVWMTTCRHLQMRWTLFYSNSAGALRISDK